MSGKDLVARTRRTTREGLTLLSAMREPRYRRLSRSYVLPGHAERVYCYHVRKTAGTSLHLSFLALGGEDPIEVQRRIERAALHRTTSGRYAFVAHQRSLLDQGHYFYGWSHLPAHRLSLPPRTFTVTILRDPVDRVLSYYSYLRQGDAPDMAFPVGELERALTARGFGAFLDVLPRPHLLAQLFMFSRTFDVSAATERILACSSVLFTEEYDAGLSSLGRRLSLALEARRDRASVPDTAVPAAEYERLRDLLDPEYRMLADVRQALGQLGRSDAR